MSLYSISRDPISPFASDRKNDESLCSIDEQSPNSPLFDIFQTPTKCLPLLISKDELPHVEVIGSKLDMLRLVHCVIQRPCKPRSDDENDAVENGRKYGGKLYNEAVQFELSILHDGKEHQVTRTLESIVQLRSDLNRELKQDKNGSCMTDDKKEDEVIPEIPSMSRIAVGFEGGGFTMFHALVVAYVPVIEKWLQNTIALAPRESARLSSFLNDPYSA